MDRLWSLIPRSVLEALRQPVALFLAWLARVLSGATVAWVRCQPSMVQRVYYFNHTSHADVVLLWAVLPPEIRALTRPVAAEEYWNSSRLRHYVAEKVFNAVFVSREATALSDRQEQIERMREGLGKEHSLIFAPEGTRGTGDEIKPFKSGLYHLCLARPDVELVPVYLENLNRLLPKGEFVPLPLLCRVYFGEPLRMQPGEDRDAFLDRTRAALLDLSQQD